MKLAANFGRRAAHRVAAVVSPRRRVELAIEEIESGGDPCAVSPSGRHYGAWQMSAPRARDVGHDIHDILCDRAGALRAFRRDQWRYADTHRWEPDWQALSWKAGPGAASWARIRGLTVDAAAIRLERGQSPWDPIPNVSEYLRRFRRALGGVWWS